MAEYRRFVAYVYEYLKGKKGSNCGFIRVEAWGKVCRMEIHLRCPGLLAGQRTGALQRVRAVIVSAQGKLGKLLQKQRLIPAKEDVAVFHVRL